jgi:hypothetical protein
MVTEAALYPSPITVDETKQPTPPSKREAEPPPALLAAANVK